jgi:glycerophosphoryl diester phosphodiesterase
MPENTIPAFLLALDSGVTTLELDLAVTKDKQLVVSHEPWMNAAICLDPAGQSIEPGKENEYNIFRMTYAEVKLWDCGSKGNENFPEQKKMRAVKPLLTDVLVAVEDHIKSYSRYEVNYNIEIKSDPENDNIFHPGPEEFVDLVIKTLEEYIPLPRINIQSFDFRILKYIHIHYPHIRLAALIGDNESVDANLKALGFIPDIYSPYFELLNTARVKYLHTKKVVSPAKGKGKSTETKVRVVPWTVNDIEDMQALKKMGVDGIITDYPNRARKLN